MTDFDSAPFNLVGTAAPPSGGVPAYFPSVGGVVQANTNTVESLMTGDPGGLQGSSTRAEAVFNAWCGGAYASLRGTYGSMLNHGGGHAAGYDNAVYELDFNTRLWSRTADPTPPSSWSLNYTFGELAPGKPMATHTYDHLQYWPGGGAQGEFLLLWHTSNHVNGGGVSNYTHIYDLATGVWRRQSGSIVSRSTPAESTSAYDASRDVFWGVTQVQGVHQYNPNTESWTTFGNNSANFGLDTTSDIYPAGDAWIFRGGRGSPSTLYGIDLASPSTFKVTLNQSGSGPGGGELGFEWVPPLGEFASYDWGSSNVYFVKPPAGDWRTGTWTWRSVSLSGSVPHVGVAGQSGPFSQFRYISAITSGVYFVCTSGVGNCYVIRTS